MVRRGRLTRLERLAEGEMIAIPQQDGTVAKFPPSAAKDAYLNLMARMGAGEDAPAEHPLMEAARNSTDGWWSTSLYATDGDLTAPIPDLSE
jgi:hypothetical protein